MLENSIFESFPNEKSANRRVKMVRKESETAEPVVKVILSMKTVFHQNRPPSRNQPIREMVKARNSSFSGCLHNGI